jgi:hypothetical protein
MAQTSVTLDALTETVARAIEKYPEQRSRIERAAQLIATGHVEHLIADLYAVRSQTDDTTYIVDNSGCPCIDSKRQPLTCKHRWSITLLVVAQERARRASEMPAAGPAVETPRELLAWLIGERARRGRIVAAEGGRAVLDPECVKLDEHIARLRASLAPVSFRESVAA